MARGNTPGRVKSSLSHYARASIEMKACKSACTKIQNMLLRYAMTSLKSLVKQSRKLQSLEEVLKSLKKRILTHSMIQWMKAVFRSEILLQKRHIVSLTQDKFLDYDSALDASSFPPMVPKIKITSRRRCEG